MKNILMLASEAVPFIKTGGLADVVGSLPKTIDKQYYDCRVMIPKYMCIPWEWRQKMEYVTHFYMNYLGQDRYVGVLKYEHQGVIYYFIDNESYFSGDRPDGDRHDASDVRGRGRGAVRSCQLSRGGCHRVHGT